MTNTKRLTEIIDASGYKRAHIADRLEISRQSLTKKINNVTEFKGSEINTLIEILDITDVSEVFFASNVINNQQQIG